MGVSPIVEPADGERLDGARLLPQHGDERSAERAGHLVGEVGLGGAPDVVLAESVAGDVHGHGSGSSGVGVWHGFESVVKLENGRPRVPPHRNGACNSTSA